MKRDYFDAVKADYLKISGVNEGKFLKEISFAVQIVNGNKLLAKASRESLFKCVLNVAQTGLTLNPTTKFAYLVPRYNRQKQEMEACLEPSYAGMIDLLVKSGAVKSLNVQLIYEGDEIEVDMASEKKIMKHIPYIINGNSQGKVRAVYSLATLNNGDLHCELMSFEDVMDIRATSESYKAYKDEKIKSCIWITYEGEMIRKTVVKRHYKYLPKSDGLNQFNKAVEVLNEDYRQKIDYNYTEYLEQLVNTSTLEQPHKDSILTQIWAFEYKDEAKEIEKNLWQHQVDAIDGGNNYNQTDIKKKLDLIDEEK